MAKLVATESAQQVIDDAVQLLGARGVVRRRAGRAALPRDPRAAHLRGHERDPEARHRRAGAAVTDDRAPTAHRRHASCATICRRGPVAATRLVGRAASCAIPTGSTPRRSCSTTGSRSGHGDRTVLHHAGGPWTYQPAVRHRQPHRARARRRPAASCRAAACCCAAPNHPMLVACWFARAQGRRRRGDDDAAAARAGADGRSSTRPRCSLALTDARVAADLETALARDARARASCASTRRRPDALDAR